MGLFGKILDSGEKGDGAIEKLRRELRGGRKLSLEYGIYAREVAAAKLKQGLLQGVDREVLSEMIEDWEERLENIVARETYKEVDRLGKWDEFNKVIESDIDRDAYLTHVIPNYRTFLEKTIAEAKTRM